MYLFNNLIKSIFLPFLFIFPLLGYIACTSDVSLRRTDNAFDTLGQSIADIPENVEAAAPMIQGDIKGLWADVSDQMVVYGEGIGISEPPHPLAEAEEAREKLISGASFREVVANAMGQITPDDLANIHSSELARLNGILPFEIDVNKCGESLAEVLNSLDIGQVSAVLQSSEGYHLIQLIDRNGANVRIGHLLFQVDPNANDQSQVSDKPTGYDEAVEKLTKVLEGNR